MVKRRNKSKKKKEVKVLIVVTLICFLLAVVVSFITGRVPTLLDRVITKRIEARLLERLKIPKRGLLVPT